VPKQKAILSADFWSLRWTLEQLDRWVYSWTVAGMPPDEMAFQPEAQQLHRRLDDLFARLSKRERRLARKL
jgi:hypothetical protein